MSAPPSPKGDGFWFCTGFAVSNLASPFGWEVGPLGLGGGSSLAGVYGLSDLVRFCLRGELGLVARLGGSLGLRASSPLPSPVGATFPQGGRLLVGALVGCYSMIAIEAPLSIPLEHLSSKEFFDEYCSV